MTRRRLILVAIAAGLTLAWVAGGFRRDIDAATATRLANRMARDYLVGSGEGPGAYNARETRQWADGWEFRWRYRPCPEFASLRVWISRDGRRARYAELPACTSDTGLAQAPRSA